MVLVPRQRHWKIANAFSFDDPVPLTRHDSIDIQTRGARKKRSHPWLPSWAAIAA